MDVALGICLGIGLAAACGFRVFVPMFAMSLAAKAGYLDLADGFGWMDSWGAITAFGTATTPAAIIAGAVATAAVVTGVDPLVQWTAAIIGGAGVAGTVQSSSVAVRAASTLSTGGLGNFVVATIELVGSVLMSVIAMLLPIVAAVIAVLLTAGALSLLFRRWGRPRVTGPTS